MTIADAVTTTPESEAEERAARADAFPDDGVAFVLSGGGSLGSVQVGCLHALIEYGIRPDLIVGTSVGALNGVWLAMDPTLQRVHELRQLWCSMEPKGPFKDGRLRVLTRLLLGREYLFANDTLRRLVCGHLAGLRFQDLTVPLLVVATKMESGDLVVFQEGPLERAVLASTAIPGMFPPVTIDGVDYIDGAMMSNCGLQPAWDRGARRIVVIEAPHAPVERGFGVLKPLARALTATLTRLCHLEVEFFSQRGAVALLEPQVPLERHRFNDLSKAEILIDAGKAWTELFLESADGALLRGFVERRRTGPAQPVDRLRRPGG